MQGKTHMRKVTRHYSNDIGTRQKKFEELLGAYVYKPQGKLTLVPESDKRPAINTAKEDFSEN